jgi:hypothetical protein
MRRSPRLMTRASVRPLFAVAALLCAGTAAAQAENYQPIRFNVGFLIPYIPGMNTGGVGTVVEGKYNISDNIAAGFRLDGSVYFGSSVDTETVEVNVGAVASLLAKGEFFLTDSTVRPFVGFGAGSYWLGGQSVTAGQDGSGVTQAAGNVFGVAPELGVDLGIVRLAATYNMLLDGNLVIQEISTDGNPPPSRSVSRNYFAFEVSFRIGGRRRTRPAVSAGEAGATSPSKLRE